MLAVVEQSKTRNRGTFSQINQRSDTSKINMQSPPLTDLASYMSILENKKQNNQNHIHPLPQPGRWKRTTKSFS